MTSDEEITRALRSAARLAQSPSDFEARVIRSFGENFLPRARQIAAEVRGFQWLRGANLQSPASSPASMISIAPTRDVSALYRVGWILGRFRREPSLVVLLGVAACAALLILFPPHVTPVSDGYLLNSGFAFIFSPPRSGRLEAVVNAPLLAVLLLGVSVAGVAAYVLAKRLES